MSDRKMWALSLILLPIEDVLSNKLLHGQSPGLIKVTGARMSALFVVKEAGTQAQARAEAQGSSLGRRLAWPVAPRSPGRG
ncbi:hypothetical protein BKA81DRAFT_47408 [Phyllosticta paracitricarpa]|uniref:Uncharacterized protein n=1 Tax=Phyllosticta citricarpa TaxID=55181 RepID=A0ABR1LHX5_9PEZI